MRPVRRRDQDRLARQLLRPVRGRGEYGDGQPLPRGRCCRATPPRNTSTASTCTRRRACCPTAPTWASAASASATSTPRRSSTCWEPSSGAGPTCSCTASASRSPPSRIRACALLLHSADSMAWSVDARHTRNRIRKNGGDWKAYPSPNDWRVAEAYAARVQELINQDL